jgi:hypothetical protein
VISGTTIHQVRKEISVILSRVRDVNDCFVEFDSNSNSEKIVIVLNSLDNLEALKKSLTPLASFGYNIVLRKNSNILPF